MNSILAPFIYLIRIIFETGYQLTGSYGIAILLLSFAIYLLLLPIFIYIEKAKKRDDVIKKRMQPLMDEIKQVYTGQERYYYLKTLNRQFGYSQFKALVPILSLLIQIPFFIAAYQYLENLEDIQGVAFGPLTDLSQPDHLFGIVNVLPVIMTVVNLLTAWFYTRNGNTSERKQMIVVAGIFLVLLFNLPSALVLYWTMNNVFAFLRLFITNREVFKGKFTFSFDLQATIVPLFIVSFSLLAIAQINWAVEHTTASIHIRLLACAIVCFALVSALALLWKDYREKFIILFKTNNQIYLRYIQMTLPLSVIGSGVVYLVFNKNNFWENTLILLLTSLVLLLLYQFLFLPLRKIRNTLKQLFIPNQIPFLFFIAGLYFYFSYKNHFNADKNLILYISLVFVVISQLLYTLIQYNQKPANKLVTQLIRIVIFGLTLTQLLFVVRLTKNAPIELSLYGVEINLFNVNIAENITKLGLTISGLLILSTLSDFKGFPKVNSLTNIILTATTVIFTSALVFFWHPLMVYASLPSEFDFRPIDIFIKNFHLFLTITLSLCAFYFISPRIFKPVVLIVFLVAAQLSFVNSIVIPLDLGSLQIDTFSKAQNLSASIPRYVLELGIIVGFGYVFILILRKQNSKYLVWSICCLHLLVAGQALYFVHQPTSSSILSTISNRKENRRSSKKMRKNQKMMFSKTEENVLFILADGIQGQFMEQMMRENSGLRESYDGFTWYPNTISVSNYTHTSVPVIMSGTSFYPDSLNADTRHDVRYKITDAADSFIKKVHANGYEMTSTHMHYTHANYDVIEHFIPEYNDKFDELTLKNNLKLKTYEVWYNRLWENALLNCSPLFIKANIYNNSEWIVQPEESSPIPDKYNYLKLLVPLADASSKEPNFIYLHNHAGHNPWNILNDDGTFEEDVHPYDNNVWVMQQYTPLLNWMKKEDVYDNTKIIIVSDHGIAWEHFDGESSMPEPQNWDKELAKSLDLSLNKYWRLNALLMVKDFNKKGPVETDTMLMTNADASYIAFNDSYIRWLKANGERTVASYHVDWKGSFAKFKKHPIRNVYHIKNSMFDANNWTRIK